MPVRKGLLSWGALDDERVIKQLPEGPASDITKFLEEGIRYEPRRSEALVIGRIETAAKELCAVLYQEADAALERFYESVRVHELGVGGVIKKDAEGCTIWKRDEDGQPIEDWSKLDGMDVESAVGTLQRVVAKASAKVAEMQARAMFAHEVAEDEFYEHYHSQVRGGTVEEKKASARRASRDSRFHFIVQWWVHKLASDRLRILEQTLRDLQFQRSRYIKSMVETGRWS